LPGFGLFQCFIEALKRPSCVGLKARRPRATDILAQTENGPERGRFHMFLPLTWSLEPKSSCRDSDCSDAPSKRWTVLHAFD
jgi:hypothetical protein